MIQDQSKKETEKAMMIASEVEMEPQEMLDKERETYDESEF